MRILFYLIPLTYILYISYKDQKLYRLLYTPLIIISLFGTTKYFTHLSFPIQFTILSLFIIIAALLMYFYYKDLKETKLAILKNKRQERKIGEDIQKENPTRRKKIIIQDLRTRESKVYWASPTIKDRYSKEDQEETDK